MVISANLCMVYKSLKSRDPWLSCCHWPPLHIIFQKKAVKWSSAVIQGPLQSYKVTETDANQKPVSVSYECLMITWLVRCLREFAMQTSEMCDFHQFTHNSFIWSHHKGAFPCNVTYVSKKLESLNFQNTETAWFYIHFSLHGTSLWRTDRQTEGWCSR